MVDAASKDERDDPADAIGSVSTIFSNAIVQLPKTADANMQGAIMKVARDAAAIAGELIGSALYEENAGERGTVIKAFRAYLNTI